MLHFDRELILREDSSYPIGADSEVGLFLRGNDDDEVELYEKIGIGAVDYIYGAFYTTEGMCELLGVTPAELTKRSIRAGMLHWGDNGLAIGPNGFSLALIGLNEYRELLREQWRGPHTWMMVNFYDSEPPDARRRRTIADVFFSPEAIEFLAEPS
jgi:hypothetical protein